MVKLWSLQILCFWATCILGQETTNRTFSDSTFQSLFKDGVYIENLNTLIPWNTPFLEIKKFGNPEVGKTKGVMAVTWDSVTILDGIKATLYWTPLWIFGKEKYKRFSVLGGVLDSANANIFKNYFSDRLKLPVTIKRIDKTMMTQYHWIVNDCKVSIRQWDDYSQINRIMIQKLHYP